MNQVKYRQWLRRNIERCDAWGQPQAAAAYRRELRAAKEGGSMTPLFGFSVPALLAIPDEALHQQEIC